MNAGVKLVVAVTDGQWFETLRKQPELDEINFWSPSSKNFRALRKGELFLFKLHAPRNVICGGGIFAYASNMPCSLAWQAFGKANGAHSEQGMRDSIAKYHREPSNNRSDFEIGCRILAQPFFFDESDWIPVPKSWAPGIVSLKTYSTENAEGEKLWRDVTDRMNQLSSSGEENRKPLDKPCLIWTRQKQGAFRLQVTDIYKRQCAVTEERALSALEAAHILPCSDGGQHEARNGLLLRSDIHKLFDAGYVTVTPSLHFEVSPRIGEQFEHGRHYHGFHGRRIMAPQNDSLRPNPTALTWHNENCFRG